MSDFTYHIFYTHSWVTQVVIESIIEKNSIPSERVILLYDRNFQFHLNPALKGRFKSPKNFRLINIRDMILANYRLAKFQQWFYNLTSHHPYHLYVPHLLKPSLKILSTLPECRSTSIIEEGILSYRTREYINDRFPGNVNETLRRLTMNRLLMRALAKKTIDESIDHAYAFNPEAFTYFKSRTVLKEQFQKLVQGYAAEEPVTNLFVLLAFVTGQHKINIDRYFERFEKVIQYIISKAHGQTVHYKYHPSDSAEVRERTEKLLAHYKDIRFRLLGDDVCLEFLLAKCKPKTFVFNCSLALYAKELGCDLEILNKFIVDNSEVLNLAGVDFSRFYIEPR